MRRLYLCGAGNPEGVRLALRANEALHRWDEVVLLDDNPAEQGRSRLGVPVIGGFDLLAEADPGTSEVVSLVARTTAGRRKAFDRISAHGVPFVGLISADVDTMGADVADDVLVYQNATIGPEVTIGRGSIVFMGAAVGHECWVGEQCVIASNAVLNARVVLGDGVYVGSTAVVLPEVTVGPGATIGAGAVVFSDVPPGATVVPPRAEVMDPAMAGGSPRVRPAELAGVLAGLWREVLGTPSVRPDQNFFDLGGTSLLAMRLLQRVHETLGISMSPVDIFQYPTLAALTSHLGAAVSPATKASGEGVAAASSTHLDQARLRAERRRQVQAWRGPGDPAPAEPVAAEAAG
jgi:sugar O-acyltransferase (sialic acid O-acetyltransferase NeuD family)